MKPLRALVLVGGLLGLPTQASAQAAGLRPAPSVLFRSGPLESVEADSLNTPPTHWKEGALIGAGVGVATGLWFAYEMCGFDGPRENCAPGMAAAALFLGVAGYGLGALIGGQFPKSE